MHQIYLVFVINLFFLSCVHADNQSEIDKILKQESAPLGIVFEIVESDKSALTWSIPRVKKYSDMLRERFPDIEISVVSHGGEQFGLVRSEIKQNSKIHRLVESLVKQDDIPVQVCGGHASWYDVKKDDYPDYIEVTPSGPTAISNYVDMGYKLIILKD